jgi:hypothetical protein
MSACRASVFLLLIGLLFPLIAADKAPEGSSRISGRVLNQRGQAMPNLLVKLMIPRGMKETFPTTQPLKGGKSPYIESSTDSMGSFSFEKLPAGEYTVISELDGTGRGKVDITIGNGQTYTIQVVLKARRGEKQ